jgi:hypothetical protein
MTRKRRPTPATTEEEEDYFAAGSAPAPPARKPAERRDEWTGALLPGCQAFDALPWPAGAPVLTAEDLMPALGPDEKDGRRSLSRWLAAAFAADDPVAEMAMRDAAVFQLWSVIHERSGRWWSLFEYANTSSLADAASLWNEAMRRLGFATPDPAGHEGPRPRKPRSKR